MADGTNESKGGGSGSWWTTLQGVLTAIAGLLGAIAALIAALPVLVKVFHDLWPPRPDLPIVVVDPPPSLLSSPVRVEGLEVKITTVQRIREQGATLIQLNYNVTSDWELRWHDPDHFVHLVFDSTSVAPIWTSPPAEYLPPKHTVEFSAKFPLHSNSVTVAVFRFGEEKYVDVKAEVTNRKSVGSEG